MIHSFFNLVVWYICFNLFKLHIKCLMHWPTFLKYLFSLPNQCERWQGVVTDRNDALNLCSKILPDNFEELAGSLAPQAIISARLKTLFLCKQFITRRRVVWPHLPLFQGCGTKRSRVPENPETVVNEATLPFFKRLIAFLQLLLCNLKKKWQWECSSALTGESWLIYHCSKPIRRQPPWMKL